MSKLTDSYLILDDINVNLGSMILNTFPEAPMISIETIKHLVRELVGRGMNSNKAIRLVADSYGLEYKFVYDAVVSH